MLNGSSFVNRVSRRASESEVKSVGKDRARDEFVEWNGCWATVEWLAGAASRWASFYAKFDTKTSVSVSFLTTTRFLHLFLAFLRVFSRLFLRRHNAKGTFLYFRRRIPSKPDSFPLSFLFFFAISYIVENSFSSARFFGAMPSVSNCRENGTGDNHQSEPWIRLSCQIQRAFPTPHLGFYPRRAA